jgi:CheY-like chemotaxis protein
LPTRQREGRRNSGSQRGERFAYRILIVENDADSREGLALLLGLDHSVETARNGHEVLDLLAHRTYDVILSDLRMPGMSGAELNRRIAQGWPHLASRVVFLTALRPDQAWDSAPSVTILTKPVSPERLQQTIAEVAARGM